MLVVNRFDVAPGDAAAFLAEAQEALTALSARPGYRSGRLGRAADDERAWVLATEWDGVGAYRRALSAYDVKLRATVLLSRSRPEPSAYEILLRHDAPPPARA